MIKKFILRLYSSRLLPKRIRTSIDSYMYLKSIHSECESLKVAYNKGIIIKSSSRITPEVDYSRQFKKIVEKIRFRDDLNFIYPFDTWIKRRIPSGRTELASITVDFATVLDTDIRQLSKTLSEKPDSAFRQVELSIIQSIELLADRTHAYFTGSSNPRLQRLSNLFPEIIYRKPLTFEEALQKILFYNALFWQMGHRHIGLGRLDKILYPYYQSDIAKGTLDYDKAKQLLKDFCELLHIDIISKSLDLLGDTGQYILLGGKDIDGNNIDNDLTKIFLEIFAERPMADPKLILRVNNETSDTIWSMAINSIIRGSGSPLLMNEDAIIPGMIKFGYEKEDMIYLGTSACWEPLVIGKSFDQNNPFPNITPLKILEQIIASNVSFASFDKLITVFEENITQTIKNIIPETKKFDCSPLFSLFFDNCIERSKDFSDGGAKYSFHGAQVVSLPNTINSLINIKKFVFDDKIITMAELRDILSSNFKDREDIRRLFLSSTERFGKNSPEVLNLTNKIMNIISGAVSQVKCNGESLKVGFSSPAYISYAKSIGASADGRYNGDPLAVHISPLSEDIDIFEILNFATNLDYSGNRLNGNVVDFILPTSYVKAPNKLIASLKNAIKEGLYEIQLNVIDKKTLIDAKKHPEKYPDLIVRVWGFSSFFNDLPEVYKDNLIARAI